MWKCAYSIIIFGFFPVRDRIITQGRPGDQFVSIDGKRTYFDIGPTQRPASIGGFPGEVRPTTVPVGPAIATTQSPGPIGSALPVTPVDLQNEGDFFTIDQDQGGVTRPRPTATVIDATNEYNDQEDINEDQKESVGLNRAPPTPLPSLDVPKSGPTKRPVAPPVR